MVMPIVANGEGFIGDLHRLCDIRIGQGCVDEVIVMVGEIHAPFHTFRYPFLMEGKGRIIRDAEIEQGGDARHVQIEGIVLCGGDQTAAVLSPFFRK